MPSNLILRQTSVHPDVIQGLKVFAAVNRKLLIDVFELAMTEFLEYRTGLLKEKRKAVYLVGPSDAQKLNVRLAKSVAGQVDKAAEKDGVKTRRLVYTAIIHFANKHGIAGAHLP